MDDEKKTAGAEDGEMKSDAEEQKTSTEREKKGGARTKTARTSKNSEENKAEIGEQKAPKRKRTSAKKSDSSAEENAEDVQIDAPSIDSLLYDSDDGVIIDKKDDDRHSSFAEFLADYKAVIGKSLAMAKSASRPVDAENAEEKPADANEEKDPSEETFAKEPTAEDEPADSEAESSGTEENTDSGTPTEDDSQIEMELGRPTTETSADENDGGYKYDPEKPRIIDSVFDFVELFIFTLAAVLVITTFFFKHTVVEGGSMMNTLQDEEHLIISDLFYTPERGDIIVFADYSAGQKTPYVKRVIAIAGDTVRVTSQGKVTVNGEELDEDYVFIDGDFPAGYYGKECTVPEGEVFVLGDHRNASSDSVTFPNTTVKVDSILGKVLFRIYPFDKFGTVD